MSYPVTFYSFAKEVNSTKRPTGTGTLLNCTVNDRINIISPVIAVNLGRAGSLTAPNYNYCYIPIFSRYYFVENWEYRDGLWWASCSVDVLATYKTEIGSMSAYVLRSAFAYDGAISDGLYPAKDSWSFASVSIDNPWKWDTYTGTYCLGVAGALTGTVGSPRYYLFNWSGFTAFLGKLLSDDYVSDVIGAWGLSVDSEAKAIVDPLQYITSAVYLPIDPPSNLTTRDIPVGFGTVEATAALIDGAAISSVLSYDITNIPRHSMVTSRGVYMNAAPWTSYTLDFPPYGSIELDPSKIDGSVHITVTLDKPTGMSVLRVFSQNNLISLIKGSLGVTVPISQIVARGMSTLSQIQHGANLVSQVMGGITGGGGTGGMAGNVNELAFSEMSAARGAGAIVGGVASLASGASSWVRDFIESKIPSSHTIGSVGSYAELVGRPTVYAQFLMPVDDSIRTRGRPLYSERVLNTLPGYQLIADPDLNNVAATATERDKIISFLTGGYYYE